MSEQRAKSRTSWKRRFWRGAFGALVGTFIGWLTTFGGASSDWIAFGGVMGFVVAFALGLSTLRDIVDHLT